MDLMSSMKSCFLRFFLLCLLLTTWVVRELLAQEPSHALKSLPFGSDSNSEVSPSKRVCADFGLESDGPAGRSCQRLSQLAFSGKWGEARGLAEKLAADLPDNGVGPYWLGLEQLQAGHAISGFRQLDKALALSPDVFWVHLNLGLAYALLRQNTLFEEEMRWVIDRHPDQALPFYYLGRHYAKTQEDTDKGLSLLRKAVYLNPADFRSRYHLGYLLELKDHPQEAKTEYQEAQKGVAASGSSYSWPLQGLARLELQEANLVEAFRLAQQAVKTNPKLSESHLLLARILQQRGRNRACHFFA